MCASSSVSSRQTPRNITSTRQSYYQNILLYPYPLTTFLPPNYQICPPSSDLRQSRQTPSLPPNPPLPETDARFPSPQPAPLAPDVDQQRQAHTAKSDPTRPTFPKLHTNAKSFIKRKPLQPLLSSHHSSAPSAGKANTLPPSLNSSERCPESYADHAGKQSLISAFAGSAGSVLCGVMRL